MADAGRPVAVGISIDDWRARGTHVECGGHRLFTIDEGEGPTVVAIHGFPTASWDWAPMWGALTARHRVLAMDLLGFGFSDKPRGHRYSILEQADLVEALAAAAELGEAHLLAHDYGDSVAQELLARDLERRARGEAGLRWTKAVLLNGGLFPETHHPVLVQRLLLMPAVGALVAKAFNRTKLRANFDRIFGDRKATDAELDVYWDLIERDGGRAAIPSLIHYMPERVKHRERWVGALQKASEAGIPLRLVDGVEDPVSGGHMVERYRELIPNPDTVTLDGVGHYPQVEAPERVLKALLPFLDGG